LSPTRSFSIATVPLGVMMGVPFARQPPPPRAKAGVEKRKIRSIATKAVHFFIDYSISSQTG
jgi:hypothetical protein